MSMQCANHIHVIQNFAKRQFLQKYRSISTSCLRKTEINALREDRGTLQKYTVGHPIPRKYSRSDFLNFNTRNRMKFKRRLKGIKEPGTDALRSLRHINLFLVKDKTGFPENFVFSSLNEMFSHLISQNLLATNYCYFLPRRFIPPVGLKQEENLKNDKKYHTRFDIKNDKKYHTRLDIDDDGYLNAPDGVLFEEDDGFYTATSQFTEEEIQNLKLDHNFQYTVVIENRYIISI